MKLGFIGTGSITEALVTSFCACPEPPERITVSPRNRDKAMALANAFSQVRVAASNQQVLDESEWVFLAVLPERAQEILTTLSFRKDHKVISLLAGTALERVDRWISPARQPVRAIPMPFVTRHMGPIVICPHAPEVSKLLAPLGKIIPVETEHEFNKFAALSALMAPYYGLMHHVVEWARSADMNPVKAAGYTASMFGALSVLAQEQEDGDMEKMKKESITPGGLNELATQVIESQKGFAPWTDALVAIQERLTK